MANNYNEKKTDRSVSLDFFASYALPESEMSSKDSDFLGTSIIFKNIYPLKLIYELSDRLNLSSIPFYKNIFIQIFNISLKRWK